MDKLFENKQIFENIKSVVEVSQQRGCWKASEMTSIGAVWTDINNILTYIQDNTPKEGNTAEGNTAEGNTAEENTAEGNTAEGNTAKEDKLNQSDIK